MINSSINENFSKTKFLSNVPFRLNQRNSGEFNTPVPSDPKEEGTGVLNVPESSSKFKELVEEEQSSIRETLYSLEIKLDRNFDKINENFDKIDKYFDTFAERFDKIEEIMAKRKNSKSSDNDVNFSKPLLNMVGVQFVDGDKPEVKTLVEPDIETETKNFLIEESSGKVNFPRLSDINEEGLGKFTFPKVLSKSPLAFLKKLSNSRIYVDLSAINQYVLVNLSGIPADPYILPNLFAYWSEENLTDSNGQGYFFETLILFLFNSLAIRMNRLTGFLYLYTMYWDIR